MPQLQPSPPTPHARSHGSSGKRAAGKHPLPERSASFHSRTRMAEVGPSYLRRHRTHNDLLPGASGRKNTSVASTPDMNWRKVPEKVLMNVNVWRSLGALQVMASTGWTVEQLAEASLKQYVKEGRRPLLTGVDPQGFSLHYSQFSLQGLDPKEKLMGLGSRNFFLCPKSVAADVASGSSTAATNEEASSSSNSTTRLPSSSSSSCSDEAGKASRIGIPWLKFMDFLF